MNELSQRGLARERSGPADQSVAAWQVYRAEKYKIAPGNVCPTCKGLGWLRIDVPTNHARFGRLVQCGDCATEARRQWLMQNCGLEGKALNCRLTDWRLGSWPPAIREEREGQRRQAKTAIEKAIERGAGNFTFWGDFGAGKTHALVIIANEMRGKLVEVFYAPMALVLDHLRSMFQANQDTTTFWERLLDVPVLCLDEVTRIHATDWAMDRLFVLADTRYRRRDSHLTVFASNDDPRQPYPTTEAIGYLFSRMREGTLIELRGDMRQAAAEVGK